jgi:hypothetical protein
MGEEKIYLNLCLVSQCIGYYLNLMYSTVTTQLTSFGARKCPVLAPALKEDRSFSVFFPFRACPALFAGARAEKGENVDFPNAAE